MTFATLSQKLAIATGAIAAASFLAAAPAQALELGKYNFDLAGTGGTLAPSTTAPGVTLSNFSYSGSATPTFSTGNPSTGDAYSASAWTTATNFFSFVLTPGADPVSLTSILVDAQSSGTGPATVNLRSSLDGFASVIASGTSGNGSFAPTNTFNLNSAFSNLTNSVTFRIVGVGPTSANGGALASTGTLRVDNVTINGDVATAVPTPALLPALIGFGASIVRKRKQETV